MRLPETCRIGLGLEYDPRVSSLSDRKEYIRKSIKMTIDKHPLIDVMSNDAMLDRIIYIEHDSINGGKTVLLEGYITIKEIYEYSNSGSGSVG